MSVDGVIDEPTWTFDYGFDPKMGEAFGAVTEGCRGILLGRTTYEMFEPSWSTRTVEDDPGAPFFNDTTKYVVSGTLTTATWRNSKIIGPYDPDAIRSLKDEATATSTSAAAARWSERCSRTAWSTSCTCSSTRSPAGSVRDSSLRKWRPATCHLRPVSRTRTVWSTWSTDGGQTDDN